HSGLAAASKRPSRIRALSAVASRWSRPARAARAKGSAGAFPCRASQPCESKDASRSTLRGLRGGIVRGDGIRRGRQPTGDRRHSSCLRPAKERARELEEEHGTIDRKQGSGRRRGRFVAPRLYGPLLERRRAVTFGNRGPFLERCRAVTFGNRGP